MVPATTFAMTSSDSQPDPAASATDWGLLRSASSGGPEAKDSLAAVAQRYWGPIFAAIRAVGRPPDEAADLTQGFIADVLLGRPLLARATPDRGRFRSFLRQAVLNYVRDRHRQARSLKRHPTEGMAQGDFPSFDIADPREHAAGQVFDAHWTAQIVRVAIERTRLRTRSEGRELAWSVFERRTLRPCLFGDPVVSYADLVSQLGLDSIGQAVHAAIVGRRLFVEELTAEVRATLGPGESLTDELKALLAATEASR
jgi:RNA polymerase sigma-70 factor (ECF subfamily)